MAMAIMAISILAAVVAGVAASSPPDPRSYLTSWGGPGCTTASGWISSAGSCGCNNLAFYGGHEFNFRGETATLYTSPGCAGTPYQVFEDTQACDDFGWRSINIDC